MPRPTVKKAESLKERKGKRLATEDVTSDEEPKAKAPKIERNGTANVSKSKAKTVKDPSSPLSTEDSGVEATGGSDEGGDTAVNKSKIKEPRKKAVVGRSASARVAKTTAPVIEEDEELEETEAPKKSKITKSASVRVGNRSKNDSDKLEAKPPKGLPSKTTKALASIREKVAKKPPKIEEESSEDETQTTQMSTLDNTQADTNNNSRSSTLSRSRMATAAKRAKLTVPPAHDRGAGQAFAFGTGNFGQLGLGEGVLKRNYPSRIDDLQHTKVLQVAAGGVHTVVLTEDGKVWTFGVNDDKALGRVTEEEEDGFSPGLVELPKSIVQVTAGDSHSAALTEDGDVYAWGTFKDMNGNFGLVPGAGELCRIKPQFITRNVNVKVKKIASGDNHLAMLTHDGKIYTCGTGEQGQLGRPKSPLALRRITRSSASHSSAMLNERDTLLTPMEVKIPRKKFMDVWTGSFSTYCQTERNNEIWVFGLNNYYQLGLENNLVVEEPTKSPGFKGIKWSQIAAGQHHAVALDRDGKTYSLGRATDGRLGLGDILNEPRDRPQNPENEADEARVNDNEAISKPTLLPTLKDVKCVQVSAGLSTAYALTSNGKLYAWGCGVNHQLGTATTDDLLLPRMLENMVVSAKKMEIEGRMIYVSGGGQHVAVIMDKLEPEPTQSDPTENK